MLKLFKASKEHVLVAVCDGTVIPMEEVPDPVFSEKMMGEGIAFLPKGNRFVAPADVTIKFVPETKHAIGMTLDSGMGMIMHIGLDTVHLKGHGFTVFCKEGQKVKKGDLLVEVSEELMQREDVSLITPLVIVDHEDFGSFKCNLGSEAKAGETQVVIYSR